MWKFEISIYRKSVTSHTGRAALRALGVHQPGQTWNFAGKPDRLRREWCCIPRRRAMCREWRCRSQRRRTACRNRIWRRLYRRPCQRLAQELWRSRNIPWHRWWGRMTKQASPQTAVPQNLAPGKGGGRNAPSAARRPGWGRKTGTPRAARSTCCCIAGSGGQ